MQRSLEVHRLEIICLALIILFIVFSLVLVIATAVRWPLQVDIEHGRRNSLMDRWGGRIARASATHYRDSSADTHGSRRTSIADSIKELKDSLSRNVAESLPNRDLISWNANIGDALRRLSAELQPSLILRRQSSPGAAYGSRECEDLEEGPASTGTYDAASPTEGPRRRSGKGDAGGSSRARFHDSSVEAGSSLMD